MPGVLADNGVIHSMKNRRTGVKGLMCCLGVFFILAESSWATEYGVSLTIENASFESPAIDVNGFPVLPWIDGWREWDVDTLGSQNTGVFANGLEASLDHVVHTEGSQLVFLGSQTGNALEQDTSIPYRVGYAYELTIAVCGSGRYPPLGALEVVLYYLDGNEPVDIASDSISAEGISIRELVDFSLYLPVVEPNDAWADRPIGLAFRAAGEPGGFWDLDNVRLVELLPVTLVVANASFELPVLDVNAFDAVPVVDDWVELDVDRLASQHTGVFRNSPADTPGHIINAHGHQLAFLGSEVGNGLVQEVNETYLAGSVYRLTAAVAISERFPPCAAEPLDLLELSFYYSNGDEAVEIVQRAIDANGLSSSMLKDISVYLPTVSTGDPWMNQPIGIALRAIGDAGGFWDIDHIRLDASLPLPDPNDVVDADEKR
jgi:hypothetical protein